jgi:hypothetical protein
MRYGEAIAIPGSSFRMKGGNADAKAHPASVTGSISPDAVGICFQGRDREPARPSDEDLVPKLSAERCRASNLPLTPYPRPLSPVRGERSQMRVPEESEWQTVR